MPVVQVPMDWNLNLANRPQMHFIIDFNIPLDNFVNNLFEHFIYYILVRKYTILILILLLTLS